MYIDIIRNNNPKIVFKLKSIGGTIDGIEPITKPIIAQYVSV